MIYPVIHPRLPSERELLELYRRYPEINAVLLDCRKDQPPPPPGVVTVDEMRELLARPEKP